MKKPLEIIGRNAYYPVIPGFFLLALLAGIMFLTGCEPSSGGPPGAAMGPPGSPTPGGGVPGAPVPGNHGSSSDGPVTKRNTPSVSVKIDIGPKPATGAQLPGVPPGLPAGPSTAELGTKDAPKLPDTNLDKQPKPGDLLGGIVNPMAPLSKVEQAGSTVELASEIIAVGANPFLNRLPKPIVEAVSATGNGSGNGEATSSATPPPPPADPFESISLLGIAYHPKAPMALISVSGTDSQTRMVRQGDTLTVDADEIKVVSIGPTGVDLQRMGSKSEKRTLNLPSIVGYLPSSAASGKSGESASAGESSPSMMPGQAGKKVSGGQSPDLANLARIAPGEPNPSSDLPKASSSKVPTGLTKVPTVNLKEP